MNKNDIPGNVVEELMKELPCEVSFWAALGADTAPAAFLVAASASPSLSSTGPTACWARGETVDPNWADSQDVKEGSYWQQMEALMELDPEALLETAVDGHVALRNLGVLVSRATERMLGDDS